MKIINFKYYPILKNTKLFALIIILGFSGIELQAQISRGGQPASFRLQQFDAQEIVYSPKQAFSLEKSSVIEKQCTAYEFGKILPFYHKLQDDDFGKQTVDQYGNTVWKATITSKNALALGLYFSDFYIPKGANLFVYSPDKEQIIGSFTEINNSETGLFATELILGDKLIIEYNEPASVAGLGHFTIDEVLHAYRGVNYLKNTFADGFGTSGSCEVNVNCTEGTDYVNQRNSVVRLLIREGGTTFWCTGSIVNNVNNDRTPYILTADHCAADATTSELNQWIIYFNYQSATCNDPITEPASKTMTGCTKIAASSNSGVMGSDFYMVLLKENIPDDYNAYFMGWNRTGTGSTGGVSIHHPSGDIKKISTYTTNLISTNYNWTGALPNGFWEVVWSATENGHGVTEGGSSGSPIYSQDGFLIGTLTGGLASCFDLTGEDYYGKFDFHWDKNGLDADMQLKPWLDPNNTGTTFLSGFPVGIEEYEKITEGFFTLFPNPSYGNSTLRFDQASFGKTYTIRISNIVGQSVYNNEHTVFYQLDIDLQHLQKGVYIIEIEGNNQSQTQKISIL